MKKMVFILAMLLIAATSFGQTERRTSNTERSAQRNKSARSESNKEQTSTRQKSSDAASNPRTERKETDANRENQTNTSTRDRDDATGRQQQDNQDRRTIDTKKDINNPERRTPQQPADVDRSRESERPSQRENHAAYTVPHNDYSSPREYREHHEVSHHYNRLPESRSYRSVHYVYRPPVDVHVLWTPTMHRRYIEIYPMIKIWYYPMGYRIETISAYDAMFYQGEVMNVYGRVNEVFYSHGTDEYFLYFGPYYPYHDFTVVLPGWIARSITRQPMRYFENQYIVTTGLITSFEYIPEIVVRDQAQISFY
jgi:hypothetical protein